MPIGVAHDGLIVSGGVTCNTATWRPTAHKEREAVSFEMNHPAAPITISHNYVTSVCGKGYTCQAYASIWRPGEADNCAFLVYCWLPSPQGSRFSFNEDFHREMLLPYAQSISPWPPAKLVQQIQEVTRCTDSEFVHYERTNSSIHYNFSSLIYRDCCACALSEHGAH